MRSFTWKTICALLNSYNTNCLQLLAALNLKRTKIVLVSISTYCIDMLIDLTRCMFILSLSLISGNLDVLSVSFLTIYRLRVSLFQFSLKLQLVLHNSAVSIKHIFSYFYKFVQSTKQTTSFLLFYECKLQNFHIVCSTLAGNSH